MHARTHARTHARAPHVAQHTLHKPQHQHNSLLALCKQRLHCVPRLRSHTGRPLKRTKRKHSETDVSGAPSLSVSSFSAVVCVCPVAYYRWAGTTVVSWCRHEIKLISVCEVQCTLCSTRCAGQRTPEVTKGCTTATSYSDFFWSLPPLFPTLLFSSSPSAKVVKLLRENPTLTASQAQQSLNEALTFLGR